MKISKLLILFTFGFILSCKTTDKDCNLQGKWHSTSFTTSEAVDLNQDGVFSKNLLSEDPCAEVSYFFKSNNSLDRSSKNTRTGCEWSQGEYLYEVDENQIQFTVNGMKQTHTYKIEDCKLHISGILVSGMTENGKKPFLINVVLEKD